MVNKNEKQWWSEFANIHAAVYFYEDALLQQLMYVLAF